MKLLRRDLLLIGLINMAVMFCYTVLGALLPLLLKDKGFDSGTIGFAVGSISFGSVLGFLISAPAIDRFDRRWFIFAGGLTWAITSLLMVWTNAALGVALLRLAQGAGYAVLYTASLVYATQSLPVEWRGRLVGVIEAIGATSISVTPLIAYALAGAAGLFAAFLAAAGVGVLIAFCAWLLPGQAAPARVHPAAVFQILERRAVVPSLAAAALFFSASAFVNLAPLVALRLDVTQIGLFLGLRALGTVPTRLLSGYLADRLPLPAIIIPGYTLAILALLPLPFAAQEWIALGLAFLFGCGMGLASPALSVWVLNSTPPHQQAAALNTLYLFSEGSGFLGAWAFGLWLDHFNLYAIYGLCGAIFLGLLGYLLFQRRQAASAKTE